MCILASADMLTRLQNTEEHSPALRKYGVDDAQRGEENGRIDLVLWEDLRLTCSWYWGGRLSFVGTF